MAANPQPAQKLVDVRVGTAAILGRIERGLSALSIATALGLSEAELNAREQGQVRFQPEELWKLATLLEVRPGWFFESLDVSPADKASGE